VEIEIFICDTVSEWLYLFDRLLVLA